MFTSRGNSRLEYRELEASRGHQAATAESCAIKPEVMTGHVARHSAAQSPRPSAAPLPTQPLLSHVVPLGASALFSASRQQGLGRREGTRVQTYTWAHADERWSSRTPAWPGAGRGPTGLYAKEPQDHLIPESKGCQPAVLGGRAGTQSQASGAGCQVALGPRLTWGSLTWKGAFPVRHWYTMVPMLHRSAFPS